MGCSIVLLCSVLALGLLWDVGFFVRDDLLS